MHICFLPAWYYDLNNEGGGLFFKEQALALQASGLQIDMYYCDLRPKYWNKKAYQWVNDDGLEVFKYQSFAFPKRGALFLSYWKKEVLRGFALYLQKHHETPDIIHAQSLWGAYAALAIKEQYGIPFIYTEHLGRWTTQTPSARIQQTLKQVTSASIYNSAVSSTLAQCISSYANNAKVYTTPNMVDTHFFTPPLSPYHNDAFKLISIGDPWYTKGLDILIEAIGIAQAQTDTIITLSLADKIPKQADLMPLIQQYKLEKKIHFLGFLSRQAIKETLQQHDLLVSASRTESFGLSMIEALACGTPIIATRTAGGLDIANEQRGYLVDRENPTALANAILKMIKNKKQFMAQNLHQEAKQAYGHAAFCARWTGIYEQLLSL